MTDGKALKEREAALEAGAAALRKRIEEKAGGKTEAERKKLFEKEKLNMKSAP